MDEDRLKTLKIVVLIAVVLGLLAALGYAFYSFTLLWATFAAGITIGLLLILILILLILAIYFWIRMFLFKREVKKYENQLEQVNMELNRCRSQLRQKRIQESDTED